MSNDATQNKSQLNNLVSDGRIAIKAAVVNDAEGPQKDHWEEVLFWEIGRVDPDSNRVAIRKLGDRDCVAPLNPVNIEFREFEELKPDKDGNPIYLKDAASFNIALITDDVHKIKTLPNHSSRIHRQLDGQAGELDNMIWVAAIPDNKAIIKKHQKRTVETTSVRQSSLRTGGGRYLYDRDGAKTLLEEDERPEFRLMMRMDESPRIMEIFNYTGAGGPPGAPIADTGGTLGTKTEGGWIIIPEEPKETNFIRKNYKRPAARIGQFGDVLVLPKSDRYGGTIDGDSVVHVDLSASAHFYRSDLADGPIDFRSIELSTISDIDSISAGEYIKGYLAFDSSRADATIDSLMEGKWRPVFRLPWVTLDDTTDQEKWTFDADIVIVDNPLILSTVGDVGVQNVLEVSNNGAANPVFAVNNSGALLWGVGGGTAVDVKLSRGAANRLDLASGDSFNLVSGNITVNGAVGIGTSNLTERLVVGNNTATDEKILIISQGKAALEIESDSANTGGEPGGAWTSFFQDGRAIEAQIGITQGNWWPDRSSIGGNVVGNSLVIGNKFAASLALATNNAIRMTILTGGNVGIGTPTPGERFEIVSGGNLNLISGSVQIGGTQVITSGRLFLAASGSKTTPGYGFAANADTGIYYSTAGLGTVVTSVNDAIVLSINGITSSINSTQFIMNNNTIEVKGDFFFTGEGSGLINGGMYGNNIGWTSVAFGSGGDFVIIDTLTDGEANGTTFQNTQEFLIATAGKYKIIWNVSAQAAGVSKHVECAIGINGSPQAAGRNHIETKFSNQEEAMSGNAILDLAAADTVSLMITNVDDNTQVTVEHVNLTLTLENGT